MRGFYCRTAGGGETEQLRIWRAAAAAAALTLEPHSYCEPVQPRLLISEDADRLAERGHLLPVHTFDGHVAANGVEALQRGDLPARLHRRGEEVRVLDRVAIEHVEHVGHQSDAGAADRYRVTQREIGRPHVIGSKRA